jgi:hypothetical protein
VAGGAVAEGHRGEDALHHWRSYRHRRRKGLPDLPFARAGSATASVLPGEARRNRPRSVRVHLCVWL